VAVTQDRAGLAVVVPVRNAHTLLTSLFDALDVQTYPPDEVIVVDDGSTDGSAALCRERGARVLSNPGQGPYAGRNAGWRSAGAELVAFVDARSRPGPSWAGAVRDLLTDETAAMATTGTEVVGGHSAAERAAVAEQIFGLAGYVDAPWFLPYFATCNLTVRRRVLAAVGGFDVGRSGGDADLCFRIQLEGHGRLAVDRRDLMRWQARVGLRSSLEQWSRYGRSNAELRVRYRDHGVAPLPAGSPVRIAARGLRAGAALAVRRNRPGDPATIRNVVTIWYSLYGLGQWRGMRSVRSGASRGPASRGRS